MTSDAQLVPVVEPGFRIHHLLDAAAARDPDAIAVVTDSETVSYCELRSAALRLADLLRQQGVAPGDRVALIGENSVEMVAAIFAASVCDAASVPINARLTPFEVANILEHCDPRLVILATRGSPSTLDHARRLSAVPHEHAMLAFHVLACTPRLREPTPTGRSDQTAFLMYTSGTTGRPKGVMLTHANIAFAVETSARARDISSTDCVYAAVPITHIFGLSSVLLSAISRGARVRLTQQFSVDKALADLRDGLTIFHGVPAMYERILERVGSQPVVAPRLRFVHCGGATLDLGLKQRIEQTFGWPLNNGYGMTEASPSICMVPANVRTNDARVGVPIPGLQTKIVNDQGVPVGDGAVGELIIRGPNIMKGYFRDPAETALVLQDGWLKTGDLVKVVDGAMYVMGRKKELIIRSGFNVYPAEVEAAINSHPAVRSCCVVGVSTGTNEAVVALVVTDAAALDSIQETLVQRLSPYKRPQHLFACTELPMTASGKVRRNLALEMAVRLVADAKAVEVVRSGQHESV